MAEADGQAKEKPAMSEILKKAGKRALGGGLPGFVAMIIQVRAVPPCLCATRPSVSVRLSARLSFAVCLHVCMSALRGADLSMGA